MAEVMSGLLDRLHGQGGVDLATQPRELLVEAGSGSRGSGVYELHDGGPRGLCGVGACASAPSLPAEQGTQMRVDGVELECHHPRSDLVHLLWWSPS